MVKNYINEWKKNNKRFSKYSILEYPSDGHSKILLRKYVYEFVELPEKKDRNLIEYAIWCNDINIERMRESEHWMMDATFHHPKEFIQMLIIIYIDPLTKENIPGMYILMNSKNNEIYESFFLDVKKILS